MAGRVNTTYEPFSVEPIYVEANRRFVASASLDHVQRMLDLACGTGTVSELLTEAAPTAHLNGVDRDPIQIELCQKRFRRLGYEVCEGFELAEDWRHEKPILTFGVGSADDLPFPEQAFDCVTISHAIHLLPDQDRLLSEIVRVLKPGGLFGFNTAFYAGCMPSGSDRVYLDWIRLATEHIQKENESRVAANQPPIKRVRGTAQRGARNRWESPPQWSERLAARGLRTENVHERRVELDARCLALVGAYGGMAEVMLSGFPVADASAALQATAASALEASGATCAPRNYLEIWSRRS